MCHYDSLLSTVHWIPFSLTDFHQSVAFFAFYFLCKFARCYLLHGGLHTSVKLAFGTSLQKIFIWHYLEVSCFNVNWTLVILGESICVLLQKTLLLMYTKAVSLPMTWYRHYIIIHSMQAEQACLPLKNLPAKGGLVRGCSWSRSEQGCFNSYLHAATSHASRLGFLLYFTAT